MMMIKLTPKTTKALKIICGIALTLGLIWYLFATRITTLALYVMIGMKAPLATRIECAKETEGLVTEKFSLPLLFDQASKDGLRTFWHYSYYASCLQNNGYDHSGNPIPVSTVNDGRFINHFGKFSLAMTDAKIISNNQVDADYDDRLIISDLHWRDHDIFVGFYKKYDPKTISEMKSEWTHFPYSDETFSSISIQDEILTASDSSGMRGCLRLYDERPIIIYGQNLNSKVCATTLESLQTVVY